MNSALFQELKKSYLAIFAVVLWFAWIMMEYFPKHPLYAKTISESSLTIYLGEMVLLAITACYIFYLSRNGGLSWLRLFFVFVLVHWISMIYSSILTDFNSIHLFGLILYMLTQLKIYAVIILLASSYYVTGSLLKKILRPLAEISYSSVELILIGLATSSLVYFILLALGVFHSWVVIGLTILPLVLGFQYIKSILNALTHKNLTLDGMKWYGYGLVSIIIGILAITFMHTNTVMPRGYDALNYYINLPNLLAKNNGFFVKGFQPYNLSIYQSVGRMFLGNMSGIMALSWSGLPLLICAMWVLGRQILKVRKEYVLFAICSFIALPAVTTQATHELKIDLMFTAFLIVMICILLRTFDEKRRNESLNYSRTLIFTSILLGLLGAFALGIKLTAIVVIATLIILIWTFHHGLLGGIFVFSLSVAIFLLMGLDDTSGLGSYHTSDKIMAGIAIVGGIISLIFALKKHKKHIKNSLVATVLIGFLTIIGFSPWLVKNYNDTGRAQFDELLNGKKPGPELRIEWPKK